MKEKLIEEIKDLIKVSKDEEIFINPNYLNYFEEKELIDIKDKLRQQKENISTISSSYLDEVYEKTKKDEL